MLLKWHVAKMTCCQNDSLLKWKLEEMAYW
jgi:hypothetical protein